MGFYRCTATEVLYGIRVRVNPSFDELSLGTQALRQLTSYNTVINYY